MAQWRAVSTGREVGGQILFRLDRKGFLFWDIGAGYVWAKDIADAIAKGVYE